MMSSMRALLVYGMRTATELFACRFGIQDNTYRDWAEKVEEQVDCYGTSRIFVNEYRIF